MLIACVGTRRVRLQLASIEDIRIRLRLTAHFVLDLCRREFEALPPSHARDIGSGLWAPRKSTLYPGSCVLLPSVHAHGPHHNVREWPAKHCTHPVLHSIQKMRQVRTM